MSAIVGSKFVESTFQWRFPTGHARFIGYVGRCDEMMNYFEGVLRCEYRKCMHNEFWVDLDEWVRKLVNRRAAESIAEMRVVDSISGFETSG